jgi:hypothetical protein
MISTIDAAHPTALPCRGTYSPFGIHARVGNAMGRRDSSAETSSQQWDAVGVRR